jgi:IstB-like ATP binding protein
MAARLTLSPTEPANVSMLWGERDRRRGAAGRTSGAFEGWGKLFGDDVIASAVLDRLLHQSEIFAINGPSHRLKDKLGGGAEHPV